LANISEKFSLHSDKVEQSVYDPSQGAPEYLRSREGGGGSIAKTASIRN